MSDFSAAQTPELPEEMLHYDIIFRSIRYILAHCKCFLISGIAGLIPNI